ncbi:tetratricopeptide repeat protein [Umezawaea sp. NPDC059074]|uniref:tetratricopeptide repeat protein n=1 Tax=Umezawaea sp. NPDC059074 TaxID=3346716 RepID=UPI0036C2304D
MANPSAAGEVELARVMAHCGGRPVDAVEFLVGAIASQPSAPEPYAALAELWRDRRSEVDEGLRRKGSLRAGLAQSYFFFLDGEVDDAAMALGSVTGARPDVAWGAAPWFGDARFLDAVSAEALAEACLRTLDHGPHLDTDEARHRFEPWFHAVDVVSARSPVPEALASMSRLPRACGRYELALALCDRADAVERVFWTAVARGTTWRVMGDLDRAVAAFEDALTLDPDNWSLHLDLADLRADQGDFAAAVDLADRGLVHEPDEVSLRAAAAAYRARLSGTPDDLRALVELAPDLENPAYRERLVDLACAGPGLSPDLVAEALRVR